MILESTMSKLSEVASIVRSKNAGPYLITFDIMCDNEKSYRRIRGSDAISIPKIAGLYKVDPQKVRVFDYPAAYSFKITIPRIVTSGDPEDPDVYGCQQHVPMSQIEVP